MTKYIVVHSGARDQYKVAETLYKRGRLGYLVTDDILFRKKYRNLFPRQLVKISLPALVIRTILKVYNFGEKLQQLKGYFLGRTAGKLSRKEHMPLLALQEYAYYAFKYSEIHPRIVFQFHPQASANKLIFEEEIKRHPESNGFKNEVSIYTTKKIKEANEELLLADYFIGASSFTKQTLVENGADSNKVFVAPYGVDTSKYPYKERQVPRIVSFVFVGSFIERKGVFYLLHAISKLEKEGLKFKFRVVSRTGGDVSLLNQLKIKNVEMFINVTHSELISILHSSDVFVFPSLFEGFGFVIVEAMSTGLPVITTSRTCGGDVISDGKEGFIIDPSNIDAIYDKMKFFINNPEKCTEMGRKSAIRSKEITWAAFEKNINNAIDLIESKK